MDSLSLKAKKFYKQGARFAKWRAVFKINTEKVPSTLAIQENAWSLGRYARTVQDAGLVPIVECEILMEGSHTIEDSFRTQEQILKQVYQSLDENKVLLAGTLLKPSMTIEGAQCKDRNFPHKIAEMTLQNLESHVPCNVPGIMFLSGGLSEEQAQLNLHAINRKKHEKKHPWTLSFCYGRALQDSCLKTWKGKEENRNEAYQVLLLNLKKNFDIVK